MVHLWERDCVVQRQHHKVIEMATAWSLPMDVKEKLHEYAVALTSASNYKNASTVEFIIDLERCLPYFIEVNPRIQVKHTMTKEVTGINLVKAQSRIGGEIFNR